MTATPLARGLAAGPGFRVLFSGLDLGEVGLRRRVGAGAITEVNR
jgi:hypothetical protein